MTWSASQYSRFEAERTRPVRDLVAAIPNAGIQTGIDLGCGPGNSTEVLQQRYPDAQVTGLDNDEDMLAAARKRSPGTTFQWADIGTWSAPSPVDVILANASLQWLPDHATLYPRLLAQLAPGGSLAIQTPDNLQEPAHVLAREVAASAQFSSRIGTIRHPASRHPVVLRPAQAAVWPRRHLAHHLHASACRTPGRGGMVQGIGAAPLPVAA